MYSQLAIVVLVDVGAALQAGSLRGHTYMIDNNRFMGSTGQGTDQLTTMVVGNQIVNWLVAGIDLSGQQPAPALVGIGGEAVEKQIMIPQFYDSPALDGNMGYWWGGTVDAVLPGKYSYTLHLDMGGTRMDIGASVNVQTGFTMGDMAASKAKMSARREISAVQKRAATDGSILNPDQHASLFTRHELGQMRRQLNKISRR